MTSLCLWTGEAQGKSGGFLVFTWKVPLSSQAQPYTETGSAPTEEMVFSVGKESKRKMIPDHACVTKLFALFFETKVSCY